MNHEESALFAKKYLEDVLSFFGLNTDIETHVSDEVIELKVPSTHLNAFLIGAHGDTLRSLQYLVSTTLKNKNAELYRINIDVADYKAQRADRLVKKLTETFEVVRSTGKEVALDPMNPADRRVVHQAISDYSDLETHSEGEGRERHIVISKKAE
jgi:spoIIIJ-associated protein